MQKQAEDWAQFLELRSPELLDCFLMFAFLAGEEEGRGIVAERRLICGSDVSGFAQFLP